MVLNGIDVSQHQGIIDWEKVSNQIDFVIIRCGFGQDRHEQDDTQFRRNADACTRLEIPFGVYIYSYARNAADAMGEAQHVLRLVQGYKLAYPIYYDLEDENTTGMQSNETIAEIAETFCSIVEENNYYVGVYANLRWWTTKLTNPIFNKYSRWIARYANELSYEGRYDMWQYSQTGEIEGVSNAVVLNYSYRDFGNLIPCLGLNGYASGDQDVSQIQQRYNIGDVVYFNYVFLNSESDNPLQPYRNIGVITKIDQGKRNPYLVGKDQGWINDQMIEGQIRYLNNPNYVGNSFSNALSQIRIDSSYDNQRRIAKINGIPNYQGTPSQNKMLLDLLKRGQLISYY